MTQDEQLRAEIDSLAGEIVHAYEELHLLYELGEGLTSTLGVTNATNLILEKILHALNAGYAELSLEDGATTSLCSPTHYGIAGGREHHLTTTLRSAGDVVGRLSLSRPETAEPFSSADGKLLDAVGTIAANAIRNAQLYHKLRQGEARLRAVLDNVAEGIVTVDDGGRIASFNPAAEQIFGYTASEVVGLDVRLILESSEPGESKARRRGGKLFPVEVSIGDMHLDSEHVFVLSVRDITARKAAEEALEHQALHDALTHLPNRVLLHDRLQSAISAAVRGRGSVALLVMDLDRFKEVNDTFGHQCGDLLLGQVGQRLRGSLRELDTIARLGGDEFAILLPMATVDEAARTANRLISALQEPFAVGGLHLELDASIGIALAPDHGADADTLLRRADVAMYVAKRGNTGWAIYDADQDQHSPARLALVGELRRAIDGNELSLHYQPKVTYKASRVTCVEALVRWNHPQHGMLSPDQFVPIAEQTGLIRPLSRWVLEAAIRQSSEWWQEGLDIAVSVNLSMRNLHDPEIVDMIEELLTRWGVPAARLIVEITESSLMADAARAMEVLTRLRQMGVGISIDDFGTGYSSLAYLKRLPVDELKIDKSFVLHMAHDENDHAIVRSTIGLAHDLGLSVVAEGVEDEAAWELLTALGCDVAQGYFVSRPLPANELRRWLATSRWNKGVARAA
jgi:diguanylate cyclase (GGDEF)-like protein